MTTPKFNQILYEASAETLTGLVDVSDGHQLTVGEVSEIIKHRAAITSKEIASLRGGEHLIFLNLDSTSGFDILGIAWVNDVPDSAMDIGVRVKILAAGPKVEDSDPYEEVFVVWPGQLYQMDQNQIKKYSDLGIIPVIRSI